MMRRVLVDAARARQATKRGAGEATIPIEGLDVAAPDASVDVIALESALAELSALDPRPAQVVEMRFYGGFSVEETADALGVTRRTVINDWNTARAWLYGRLSTHQDERASPATEPRPRSGDDGARGRGAGSAGAEPHGFSEKP
jgi:RNA polymerase sigma factor (TIGR02999 family)